MMGWAAALCFVLAGVVLACILFLIWDAQKNREPKPMATSMDIDELMLRRLKRSVATRISTIKAANK
jgi:hypothetical protein